MNRLTEVGLYTLQDVRDEFFPPGEDGRKEYESLKKWVQGNVGRSGYTYLLDNSDIQRFWNRNRQVGRPPKGE